MNDWYRREREQADRLRPELHPQRDKDVEVLQHKKERESATESLGVDPERFCPCPSSSPPPSSSGSAQSTATANETACGGEVRDADVTGSGDGASASEVRVPIADPPADQPAAAMLMEPSRADQLQAEQQLELQASAVAAYDRLRNSGSLTPALVTHCVASFLQSL